MSAGHGTGANKWVLHLIGGAWCSTTEQCHERSFTLFGSSHLWPETLEWFGIFSGDEDANPDFYNWNVVAMMYCDGGSFAGDR